MSWSGRNCLLAGFFLLVWGEFAVGGTFTDPSGFSFTYPDGWVAVNRGTLEDLNQVVQKWVSKNKIDFERVKVLVIRNGKEEFLENVNVVVLDQEIPLNQNTLGKMKDVVVQQYQRVGAKADNVQARMKKFGNRNTVVVDYNLQLPRAPFPVRQRQVTFPGGGKSYIVTCTAKTDTFDHNEPVFERILTSFQVPEPTSRKFDWTRVLTMAAVGGIVGGLVAVVIAVVKSISGR